MRPTFSKSVMVSVAISKLGCTELIFVKLGVKVDITYHYDVLLSQHVLPAICQLAGEINMFQQDNALAHRTQLTVEFQPKEVLDFNPLELLPPCSPDINSIDYRIWGCMQKHVYKKPISDLAELKQLVKVWADFKQTIIDRATDQWIKRIQACVKAKGQHFEQLL